MLNNVECGTAAVPDATTIMKNGTRIAANDHNAISVTTPTGTVVTAPYGDFADVATTEGDVFIANMGGADPSNGDTEVIVLIDDWSGTAEVRRERSAV